MLSMPLPDRDSKLAHRLVEEQGALLLDVRTLGEYQEHHLPDSLLIPTTRSAAASTRCSKRPTGTSPSRSSCSVAAGGRAQTAKNILVADGFTEVTNLGGIDSW